MNAVVPMRKPKVTEVLPPSPERVALAATIAEHVELQGRCDGAAKARSAADQAVWAARQRLDDAPELVARAKANAAKRLVDEAREIASPAAQTIREARDLLQDAEDGLDTAEASRDALRTELNGIEAALIWSRGKVQDASVAVIRVEAADLAQALAARVGRLQREMLQAGEALEWLASRAVLPVITEHGSMHGQAQDPEARIAISRLQSAPCGWREIVNVRPGALPWEAAIAALQLDASARLPIPDSLDF